VTAMADWNRIVLRASAAILARAAGEARCQKESSFDRDILQVEELASAWPRPPSALAGRRRSQRRPENMIMSLRMKIQKTVAGDDALGRGTAPSRGQRIHAWVSVNAIVLTRQPPLLNIA